MVWLVGLLLAFAALCVWLTGHWVGRVAAFLVFGVVFGIIGALWGKEQAPAIAFFGFGIGVFVAWFVSGIPTYMQRHRLNAQIRGR